MKVNTTPHLRFFTEVVPASSLARHMLHSYTYKTLGSDDRILFYSSRLLYINREGDDLYTRKKTNKGSMYLTAIIMTGFL